MSTQGLIFDIQRFSLHDGPGIRTTVFLKGCPLDCLWCHNPESKNFFPEVSSGGELCESCRSMVNKFLREAEGEINLKSFPFCSSCLESIRKNSRDGIKVIGYHRSVEEVVQEVIRDLDYYRNSGGGVTISGGEPLAQLPFTMELLKRLKELNINTAVETCGLAPRNSFSNLLPLTDLFLFDYKATGEEPHRRLTGVSGKAILSNLDFLYRNNARIILRLPLIPGINDSIAHLQAIALLAEKYPELSGIEIMPYHNMGNDKARKIGRPAALEGVKTASEEVKDGWLKTLRCMGLSKVTLS
ncbi:MAG: glycyl-radical enzyme activating protein [Ignavibacteria bacterium]|jgi:pyruvate formate lyase activating enzyme|nr:glycyl-radical enzyme activating protein [Ignavibacteria bacterium]MCU7504549.1 glycyl-radical enzyme activating protein [Ignavibacteria bacterium]MCU7516613.1 glycyl-radical enzyme activating protein [Ignavibacteria bacterium]